MPKFAWTMIILAGCLQAQTAEPAPLNHAGSEKPPVSVNDPFPPHRLGEKVGLVRGTLRRVDPIYNQLIVRAFGGGDVRIAFDGQTKLLPENGQGHLVNLPAGSVLSVDTVMDDGKLFARSVRTEIPNSAEMSGQVVHYDPVKSQLTLRDPMSPASFTLHITPATRVVKQGRTTPAWDLSSGMLVRVWLSAKDNAATQVEILAERGAAYTFEGRIVAVDLRSHVLSLANDSDQSLRELSFGRLDSRQLNLLREGTRVTIQAEFDGDHYKVRSIALLPNTP
jgi:hypothetical protein